MAALVFRVALFSVLSIVSFGVYAEIHKWVDESGKIHYGDRPPTSGDIEQLDVSIESFSSVEVRKMDANDIAVLGNESEPPGQTKKVIMYSTESCSYCKKAKAYFEINDIRFTERDINKSASAKRQWKKLKGTGVPLILVGKRKMRGFSISSFEDIYFN